MTLPPRTNWGKKGRDGRLRSPRHIEFVRQHQCILHTSGKCWGKIQVCHARDVAPRGHGGGKPDDTFTFSACQHHHRESEKREEEFGRHHGIDVLAICIEFAEASPDAAIRAAARNFKAAHGRAAE